MPDSIKPKQPHDEPAEPNATESPGQGNQGAKRVPDDPFHPDNLAKHRLSQDFESMAAVKPLIATIKTRKPNSQEFFRVRPGIEWRFETCLYEEPGTREFYMVIPALWHLHSDEIKPKTLVLTISRDSLVPFLWPLNLPSADGRTNSWNESAMELAKAATTNWVRRVSDQTASMYIAFTAVGDLPDPEWPEDLTMQEYLKLAFKDRLIDDVNHPCLRKLRGEM